jgi:hypothetical protein
MTRGRGYCSLCDHDHGTHAPDCPSLHCEDPRDGRMLADFAERSQLPHHNGAADDDMLLMRKYNTRDET